MIMIIGIIYIFFFLWYLINSWKLLAENPQASLNQSTPPFLLTPSLKIQKLQVPPFPSIENFSGSPCRKGGRTLCNTIDVYSLSWQSFIIITHENHLQLATWFGTKNWWFGFNLIYFNYLWNANQWNLCTKLILQFERKGYQLSWYKYYLYIKILWLHWLHKNEMWL